MKPNEKTLLVKSVFLQEWYIWSICYSASRGVRTAVFYLVKLCVNPCQDKKDYIPSLKGMQSHRWARMESNHRPSDYEPLGEPSIASTQFYHPHIWWFRCGLPYQIWGVASFMAFFGQNPLRPYCETIVSGFTICSIFSAAASWE